MARYIDVEHFLDLFYTASAGQDKCFIETVEMVVEDTPTADVVSVCHCPECVYCEIGSSGFHLCKRFGDHVTDSDYCSRFTRKPQIEVRLVNYPTDEEIEKLRMAHMQEGQHGDPVGECGKSGTAKETAVERNDIPKV